ncbi:MAG: ATP-binding protein [Solirubrobacteraceae bacterium]|nr:ATP-binding protein [Patulibacter sp.]
MSVLAKPSVRMLPLLAAGAGIAALGSAMLVGPGGSGWPTAVCAIFAVVFVLGEIARRTLLLFRSGRGVQVLFAVLGSAIVATAWSIVVALHVEFAAGAFVLASLGVALMALPLLDARGRLARGETPWQALAGGPTPREASAAALRRLGPLLLGALFVLLAIRLVASVIDSVARYTDDGAKSLSFALVVVSLVVGWAIARWLAPGARHHRVATTTEATVAREEQVVAAHLHDSVLQTLALIQRSAGDEARVQQLARQQERSLRAWLAGRDDATSTSLAGAVRAAAQEVEDEEPGAVIEVVSVGNAPLDRVADAMVRAAREAMRNAVRHAGSPVRVFVEVEGTRREVFVRDTGPGFDPAAVADERRGVRDAIIGRMTHVGGTARIDSGPQGTEVAIVLDTAETDRGA